MTQIMSASGSVEAMNDGQIDVAVDQFRAAMRKHREEVPKGSAQQALGLENLGMRLFVAFRTLAEVLGQMIVRAVKVDRTQTPEQALTATGRRQYVDPNVVAIMPKGEGADTTVYFFKPRPEAYDKNGLISDDNLEKEFEFVGLKPADPYTLAQFNTDDSAFADDHPHGTHWKDASGKWCFAAFYGWSGEREVNVGRDAYGWGGYWWFAGVRK